jgi:hypothetical protein
MISFKLKAAACAAAVVALSAVCAHAEVIDVQPSGFEVRAVVEIKASPSAVYGALLKVGQWWSSAHTLFGDAAGLSLDDKPGGCFCEIATDGRSAAFLRVVRSSPGRELRLEGVFGPLQDLGATGHLAWTLAAKDGGTELTQTYDVGGYAKGGFASWAGPVDRVLSEQLVRLKGFVERSSP